jgi:hypothetical protein
LKTLKAINVGRVLHSDESRTATAKHTADEMEKLHKTQQRRKEARLLTNQST